MPRPKRTMFLLSSHPVFVAGLLICFLPSATMADKITFRDPIEGAKTINGNVLSETEDGTLIVEGQDGRQWRIASQEIERRDRSDQPVPLLGREELIDQLKHEYGSGFKILETKNYIIVYSTSEQFAEDAGRLFERLKSVFENYIRRQAGFDPQRSKQPLIAVIFKSQEQYVKAMQPQMGVMARMTAGVYVPRTNRMYMFDNFGGRDAAWFSRATGATRKSAGEIAHLLAMDNISTVIHEGIHQVAFNCGFHDRNISNPVWLVEGIATVMEVPELDEKGKWVGIGQINWDRAESLKKQWSEVREGFLQQLIQDDQFLRAPSTAELGYAEGWALTYYLIKSRKKEFMKFISDINSRDVLVPYTSEERLADFRSAFGETPDQMEPDFRRFMEKTVFKKTRPVK